MAEVPIGGVKFFIGGLLRTTTEASLQQYFSEIGDVAHVEVMMDRTTGQSRGFGFVTFNNAAEAYQGGILSKPHAIDGKQVEVKTSIPREQQGMKLDTPELMIRGLGEHTSHQTVAKHLGMFGTVTRVSTDIQNPGVHYVTFSSVTGAENALFAPIQHNIDDRDIELAVPTPAAPRNEVRYQQPQQHYQPQPQPMTQQYQYQQHQYAQQQPVYQQQYQQQQQPGYPASRPAGGGLGGGKGGSASLITSADPACKIFVGGLGPDVTEQDLQEYFMNYGEVAAMEVKRDAMGKSRGFGFVVFAYPNSASAAAATRFQPIKGKNVEVKASIGRGDPSLVQRQPPMQQPRPGFQPY